MSQSSAACHALGPDEPVGPRLELPGDERRAQEDAEEDRREDRQRRAQMHELGVEPLEMDGDRRAVAVRGAGDDDGVVDVEEVRPGDGERYEDP